MKRSEISSSLAEQKAFLLVKHNVSPRWIRAGGGWKCALAAAFPAIKALPVPVWLSLVDMIFIKVRVRRAAPLSHPDIQNVPVFFAVVATVAGADADRGDFASRTSTQGSLQPL